MGSDLMAQWNPNNQPTKFCINCGGQIDSRAEICPKCGVRVGSPPPPQPSQPYGYAQPPVNFQERKSTGIAAVLSFLYVGLGQIYNGQIGKGIGMMVLGVVFIILVIFLIGIPLYIILWILGIYDAHNVAKQINAGYIRT